MLVYEAPNLFPNPPSQPAGADSTVFVCQGVTAEERNSEARVAELVPLERHLGG